MNSPEPDPVFAGLAPAAVWSHFATLCRFPRISKHEGELREHLRRWAEARGLAAGVDAAGNLLLRKPATPGREAAPGVVLQAHLDMVCEKDGDFAHDFARDAIRPRSRDGWLLAERTTLGADNGISVALMLAVLASDDLVHGPIEALLTVDEEAGMGGARGIAAGTLNGRLMLNLDTEEWGEFYLGCAGGVDVDVVRRAAAEPLPAAMTVLGIGVRGLRGGHSGVDIHEQRGNAIKLLVRVLRDLEARTPLRLAELRGGSARNALPREAQAVVAVADAAGVAARLAEWQALLRDELAGVDDGVVVAGFPAGAAGVMAQSEQAVWLASLHAAPHGVRRFGRRLAGVVETSNNLGIVDLGAAGGHCNFMVRSLIESGTRELAAEIGSLFALSGSEVTLSGEYPGWAPNPDSPLLKLCRRVYRRDFGADSQVQVIHAGLECGLIAGKHPGLDIVSFGPTIRGAHAPGEAVEIESVDRCWRLLRAILGEIAAAAPGG